MSNIDLIINLLYEFPVNMEWHDNEELAVYLEKNGVIVQKMKFAKGGIYPSKNKIPTEPEETIIPHNKVIKILGLDDIVQVVRCKDCKWRCKWYTNDIAWCQENEHYVHGNDYCSNGERKDQ